MKFKIISKVIISAVTVTCFFGCASAFKFTPEEQCAMNGMSLQGLTFGKSTGAAQTSGTVNVNAGVNYSETTQTNAFTNQVICSMPKSKEEQCKISKIQQYLEPKTEFNENIGVNRMLIGLGYALYILPGIYINNKVQTNRDQIEASSDGIKEGLMKKSGCD